MANNSNNMSGQPASSAAQNFAADLDSMFGLSAGVATLSQTVQEKKASVSSSQTELEQLEVRLRATEERLAKVSRSNSPSRPADEGAPNASSTASSQSRSAYPGEQQPPEGGQETVTRGPTSSREDYVMVDRTAQAGSTQ